MGKVNGMKNKKRILITSFLISVIFVFVSCIPNDKNKEYITTTETPTGTLIPSIVTLQHTPLIITKFISPTMKVSSTLTPSPIMTSTLNWDERDAKIKAILITNGGCDLPCFWGISPGKTTWLEAMALFKSLFIDISDYRHTDWTSHFVLVKLNNHGQGIPVGSLQLVEEKGIVTIITLRVADIKEVENYSLTEFLKKYGKPDKIGIDLNILGPFGLPDHAYLLVHLAYGNTWLHLFYNQMALKNKTSDAYMYCPNDPAQKTWDPNMSMIVQSKDGLNEITTLSDKIGHVIDDPPSVEMASNITTDQFYRNVIDGNKDFCLTSPVQYWKQFFPN